MLVEDTRAKTGRARSRTWAGLRWRPGNQALLVPCVSRCVCAPGGRQLVRYAHTTCRGYSWKFVWSPNIDDKQAKPRIRALGEARIEEAGINIVRGWLQSSNKACHMGDGRSLELGTRSKGWVSNRADLGNSLVTKLKINVNVLYLDIHVN